MEIKKTNEIKKNECKAPIAQNTCLEIILLPDTFNL